MLFRGTLLLLSASLPTAFAARAKHNHHVDNLPNNSVAQPVQWVQSGSSVVVKLDTPDCPLYEYIRTAPHRAPRLSQVAGQSAIILNFTLSADRRSLLLQDQPFLPLPNPSVPPKIRAWQIPATIQGQTLHGMVTDGAFYHGDEELKWAYVDLSYSRVVNVEEEEETIALDLDITGLRTLPGVQGVKGEDRFLTSSQQQTLRLIMDRSNSTALASTHTIMRVNLIQRPIDYLPPQLPSSDDCSLRSWRCGDFAHPPYYQYIWAQQFDEHGRKGSLRHALVRHWDCLNEFLVANVVVFQITLYITMGMLALAALGYTLYRLKCKQLAIYRRREYMRVHGYADDDGYYDDAAMAGRRSADLLIYDGNDDNVDAREAPPPSYDEVGMEFSVPELKFVEPMPIYETDDLDNGYENVNFKG